MWDKLSSGVRDETGPSVAVWLGVAAVAVGVTAYALDRRGHLDGIKAKLGMCPRD